MLRVVRGRPENGGGAPRSHETPRPLHVSPLTLERQDKSGPNSGPGPLGAGGDKAGGGCYDAAEILKLMGRRRRRCRNATMRVRSVSVKRTSCSYLRLSGVNKVEQQMDNASHSKQWHGAERTSRFRVQSMKMMIMRRRRRKTGKGGGRGERGGGGGVEKAEEVEEKEEEEVKEQ